MKNQLIFCDKKVLDDLTVIHYGSNIYSGDKVKPFKNDNFVKPIGGLWTSPINSNYGWKDWCKDESFRDCDETNSFKLKFKPQTKIIIIDSVNDLIALPKHIIKFGNGKFQLVHLDFELLATMCDAIWLTENGQHRTRFSQPMSLYGWDCESILINNGDCCYQIT